MARKLLVKKRKTFKKRKFFKRKKGYPINLYRNNLDSNLPQKLNMKMKYAANLDLTSSIIHQYIWNFSGNSPYDPNITGIGASAVDFNLLMKRYQNYRVNACSVKLMPFNNQAATSSQAIIFIRPFPTAYNSSNTPNDIRDAMSSSSFKYMIPPNAASGQYTSNIKIFRTTKNVLNIKDVADNPNLAGTSGTSPATQWYWHIFASSLNETTVVSVRALLEVTYYVTLYNKTATRVDGGVEYTPVGLTGVTGDAEA